MFASKSIAPISKEYTNTLVVKYYCFYLKACSSVITDILQLI